MAEQPKQKLNEFAIRCYLTIHSERNDLEATRFRTLMTGITIITIVITTEKPKPKTQIYLILEEIVPPGKPGHV